MAAVQLHTWPPWPAGRSGTAEILQECTGFVFTSWIKEKSSMHAFIAAQPKSACCAMLVDRQDLRSNSAHSVHNLLACCLGVVKNP